MYQTPRLLLIAPQQMQRSAAFERTTELAKVLQLPVHIVALDHLQPLTLVELFESRQAEQLQAAYLELHRQWLESQAQLMREQGVQVTCEARWVKHPYQEIQQFAREMPVALIIKDAHAEPAMRRIFYTPLDWRLLRDCALAVHLVTEARHPRPRRVLAIIDVLRSEDQDLQFNDEIVEAALKLAQQCDAELDLLHVYDWVAVYAKDTGAGALSLASGMYEALGEAQRDVYRAVAERHGVPPQRSHFIEGMPLQQICRFAEEHQSDVIVMGTTQHRGLHKRLGSTAEHLLLQAPCSIWAVKPPRDPLP
ncbi:universal stress protein [Pseudomonas sp. LD120]|uniref:universal stress protein n=1 Tax=Pseudomonas sp. LD120 TaxID=485751 RepID=UPI0013585C8D|nr:universal stress protein [Pseudomonas sp. LD120]KAF0866540.1 universal stress protein [Pseudomonas sp. LD120]